MNNEHTIVIEDGHFVGILDNKGRELAPTQYVDAFGSALALHFAVEQAKRAAEALNGR